MLASIFKIYDERGTFCGTTFFIKQGLCVTCHHNICNAQKIYVEINREMRLSRSRTVIDAHRIFDGAENFLRRDKLNEAIALHDRVLRDPNY